MASRNVSRSSIRAPTAARVIQIVSLRDHLAGDLRPSIGLLSGAVVLLLLIAMANTANLLLARASARAREMAVRNAIGADGNRLVRQLLAETLTIAALDVCSDFSSRMARPASSSRLHRPTFPVWPRSA